VDKSEYLQTAVASPLVTGLILGLTSYKISKGIPGNFESSPPPRCFSGCFPFPFGVGFLDLDLGPCAVTEPEPSFSVGFDPFPSPLSPEETFPWTIPGGSIHCQAETMTETQSTGVVENRARRGFPNPNPINAEHLPRDVQSLGSTVDALNFCSTPGSIGAAR